VAAEAAHFLRGRRSRPATRRRPVLLQADLERLVRAGIIVETEMR
jgi:hypothetical protein